MPTKKSIHDSQMWPWFFGMEGERIIKSLFAGKDDFKDAFFKKMIQFHKEILKCKPLYMLLVKI